MLVAFGAKSPQFALTVFQLPTLTLRAKSAGRCGNLPHEKTPTLSSSRPTQLKPSSTTTHSIACTRLLFCTMKPRWFQSFMRVSLIFASQIHRVKPLQGGSRWCDPLFHSGLRLVCLLTFSSSLASQPGMLLILSLLSIKHM